MRLALLGVVSRALPYGGRTFARCLWRLAAAPGYRARRTSDGLLMKLDLAIPHQLQFCLGLYERAVKRELLGQIEPGSLFIDAGANVGYFSLLAAREAGAGGKVIAFEADPANAGVLAENVRLNGIGNAEVNETAVGNASGRARFVSAAHRDSALSSLENDDGSIASLGPEHVGAQHETIEVEMTTLDAACLDVARSWPGRKVLKMDIEGAEPLALEGARGLLGVMDAVVVELNPFMLRAHGFSAEDVIGPLAKAGLEGSVIPERGGPPTPVPAGFEQDANLLFTRPR